MKAKIARHIKAALVALQEAGELPVFALPEVRVDYPKDEQFGEYTTNIALVAAKEAKENPMALAERLCEKLVSPDFAEVAVAQPGYINFSMGEGFFAGIVQQAQSDGFIPHAQDPERVMIEYSQPNTHKEFHIGHLRNVFIGSSIVRVLRALGDTVIAANYIGDTGTHIAKCLWGLTRFYPDTDLDALPDKAAFLGRVYSEANQKIEENPAYEAEFKALQKRFEAGDEELQALWEKTRAWSLEDFDRLYKDLSVAFDAVFYESEEEQAGLEIVPELLEKGVVTESNGAIVANLEAESLGVLVLVRKDGSALYGLKDLPLAKKKFEDFNIDRSIYVVDIRQSLYFRQLFKVLERWGFQKPMVHYGYEFVALKGGESMSSRKGNIVTARDLMTEAEARVKKQFPESPDPAAIALGALRFSMLRQSAASKIAFDLEEALRLEGATGPYVQYAYARMASILAKAQADGLVWEGEAEARAFHEKEKELVRELEKFPGLLLEIRESYEVHRLAHYALRLAEKFHSFYDTCRVIDPADPELSRARLQLVAGVKNVLRQTLELIGVTAPERM